LACIGGDCIWRENALCGPKGYIAIVVDVKAIIAVAEKVKSILKDGSDINKAAGAIIVARQGVLAETSRSTKTVDQG
jgi:hypothetical protein